MAASGEAPRAGTDRTTAGLHGSAAGPGTSTGLRQQHNHLSKSPGGSSAAQAGEAGACRVGACRVHAAWAGRRLCQPNWEQVTANRWAISNRCKHSRRGDGGFFTRSWETTSARVMSDVMNSQIIPRMHKEIWRWREFLSVVAGNCMQSLVVVFFFFFFLNFLTATSEMFSVGL